LRAVGFRRRAIVSLLFWETGSVSLLSAVSGAVVGMAAAWLASPLFGVERAEILLTPAVIGVVVGMVLGLLGSVPPARRAAALSPTEAIRAL
jgi:putative ABC transport system permease protein